MFVFLWRNCGRYKQLLESFEEKLQNEAHFCVTRPSDCGLAMVNSNGRFEAILSLSHVLSPPWWCTRLIPALLSFLALLLHSASHFNSGLAKKKT
ncbi:uncharacterized protein Dana_GF28011, isoform B [Drosophila ananassae]|uniref:Uncharacterized protein, isoform A n=1 Tax=Drosophila ananassae TaxID=7217 RepID=A0A0P8XRX1_DROAN|nr:uncharacterized protein Dana_GF28011, isoform A [Drosophila ananassae]KPU77395.1 uncharacterized protein Dana_GF28011, isoform B [Drosophila ananassae]